MQKTKKKRTLSDFEEAERLAGKSNLKQADVKTILKKIEASAKAHALKLMNNINV